MSTPVPRFIALVEYVVGLITEFKLVSKFLSML